LQQYGAHYHEERNHQGRQNLLLFPRPSAGACKAEGTIRCRERLGGLLKYYDRQAAQDLVGPANIKQRLGGARE
jgi:hypothetical protein